MILIKHKCPQCEGDGYIWVPSKNNSSEPEQEQCSLCYATGSIEDSINIDQESYDILEKNHYQIIQKDGYVKASKTIPEGFCFEIFFSNKIMAQWSKTDYSQPEVVEYVSSIEESFTWFKNQTNFF